SPGGDTRTGHRRRPVGSRDAGGDGGLRARPRGGAGVGGRPDRGPRHRRGHPARDRRAPRLIHSPRVSAADGNVAPLRWASMAFEPALRAGSATPEADASGLRRAFASPLVLWIAFLLVHLVLGFLAFHSAGEPLGDVYLVYKP